MSEYPPHLGFVAVFRLVRGVHIEVLPNVRTSPGRESFRNLLNAPEFYCECALSIARAARGFNFARRARRPMWSILRRDYFFDIETAGNRRGVVLAACLEMRLSVVFGDVLKRCLVCVLQVLAAESRLRGAFPTCVFFASGQVEKCSIAKCGGAQRQTCGDCRGNRAARP